MATQANEDRLDGVVLAWLWCQRGKPATAAALATGVKAMLPAGAASDLAKASLGRLTAAGHVERIEPAKKRGAATFRATPAGERRAAEMLGRDDRPAGVRPFATLANFDLPARAAGLPVPADKKAQLAFGKLLSVALTARRYGLDVPLTAGPEAAKVAMVKLALARAAGVPVDRFHLKKLPAGELPALVVGPLIGHPAKTTSGLDELLKSVASDLLGVSPGAQFKPAIVRQWLSADGGGAARAADAGPAPESQVATVVSPPGADGPPAAPPDVSAEQFVDQVRRAVAGAARAGGPGVSNLRDKVLVAAAWRRHGQLFGTVPLDRFKRRLSAVNGELVDLVREDLVPADRVDEFRESEVRNGASVYHYIRVRD